MARFIPVEIFRKKRNTFRGITFFGFLPKHPTFFVPFAWLTSARLGTLKKYRRGRKTNSNYKTIDPTEILLSWSIRAAEN